MIKNTEVTTVMLNSVSCALTKVRYELKINNEQLFKTIANNLDRYVDFPTDRRTKEYKNMRNVTDKAIAALMEYASLLY